MQSELDYFAQIFLTCGIFMKYILTFLGKFLAFIPRSWASAIARGVGFLIAMFPTPRRRALYANIKRCYPQMTLQEVVDFAKDTCTYTVEMALFVLASPYIPLEELKKRIVISDYIKSELKKRENSNRSILLMIPHFCMMESITLMPALTESKFAETGVFYRPFDNASMEQWIKQTREKHGIKLLSRKDGLFIASDFLKNGKNIALLIDQDSGASGILTLFMDMLASSTDLAGALSQNIDCDNVMFYAKRTGFWKAEIDGEYLPKGEDSHQTVFIANQWLENKLRTDLELSKQWLWLHKRWKNQNNPKKRFRIWHRGGYALQENLDFLKLKSLPRTLPYILRIPNSTFKALSSIPAIRALRKARGDASFVALLDESLSCIFDRANLSEKNVYLKGDSSQNIENLTALNSNFPDVAILFDPTKDSVSDAKKINPQTIYAYGAKKPNTKCQFFAETQNAESSGIINRYENFLKHFGLSVSFDFSDLILDDAKNLGETILLIFAQKNVDKLACETSLLAKIEELKSSKKLTILAEFLDETCVLKVKSKYPNLDVEFYFGANQQVEAKTLQNACKISFLNIK